MYSKFILMLTYLFFAVIVTLFFITPSLFLIISKYFSNNFWFTSCNEKLQKNLLWIIISGEVFGTLFFPSSQYQDILVIVFTGSIFFLSMQWGLTALQNVFCSRCFVVLCFFFNHHEYHLFVMVISCVLLIISIGFIFFSEVVVLPECIGTKNTFEEGGFSVKVVK